MAEQYPWLKAREIPLEELRRTFRVLYHLGQSGDVASGDATALFQASRSLAAMILEREVLDAQMAARK